MSNPVRFGIIGCGVAGQRHALAISQTQGAILTDASSGTQKSADLLAQKYPEVRSLSTLDLVNSSLVDVICICSPNGYHFAQLMSALKQKKPTIVEKPFAMSLKEIELIVSESKIQKTPVSVVFPRRYDETWSLLNNLFINKTLTGIKYVSIEQLYFRPDTYYQASSWHGNPKLDGGVILSQGIHYLDLVSMLYSSSGKKLELTNQKDHHTVGIKLNNFAQVDNTVSSHFTINDELLVTLNITTSASPGQGTRITIVCDQGVVVITSDKISNWQMNGVPEPTSGTNCWDEKAVLPIIHNMIDHLQTGSPLITDIIKTVESHQLAIILSKYRK